MIHVSQIASLEPIVLGPGEGRQPQPISLGRHEVDIKLTGDDTGGALSILLLRAGPMSGPPLHIHTREDEWLYVLKGELTVQVGGRRVTAEAGASVFLPRNVPHTWQNCTGETVEALGLITPPQFEQFFPELSSLVAEGGEREPLMKRYGVILVGPPLA
jgi:quercetin dioxygenase-like cupin family protein